MKYIKNLVWLLCVLLMIVNGITVFAFSNYNDMSDEDKTKLIAFLNQFETVGFDIEYSSGYDYDNALRFCLYKHVLDSEQKGNGWYCIDAKKIDDEVLDIFGIYTDHDYRDDTLYYQDGSWYYLRGDGGMLVTSIQPTKLECVKDGFYYIEADVYWQSMDAHTSYDDCSENFIDKPVETWGINENDYMECTDEKNYYIIEKIKDQYRLIYSTKKMTDYETIKDVCEDYAKFKNTEKVGNFAGSANKSIEEDESQYISKDDSGDIGNIHWQYDKFGVLTISGKGDMPDYELYTKEAPWSQYNSSIKKIVVENGITSIGSYCFNNSYVTDVELPNTLKKIGKGAFDSCDSIIEILIPDSVEFIGVDAFSGCMGLEKITLSENISCISAGTFEFCTQLKSVEIPKKVTEIYSFAFSNCDGLEKVKIKGDLTRIYQFAFSADSNLTEINLPDTVEIIDASAFEECSKLRFTKLPKNLTSIGDCAFADCITDGLYVHDGVTDMGVGVFHNSYSKSVIYGKKNSYIEQYAKENEAQIEFKVYNMKVRIGGVWDGIVGFFENLFG